MISALGDLPGTLAFTFFDLYFGAQLSGTIKPKAGDNIWIIPYDSCQSENLDKFRPLLVEDWAIDYAKGPEAEYVVFQDWPTKDYDDNNYAPKLLKIC